MFIGREAELRFLEDKYQQPGGQLVVLYGRRRVGKTETLRRFCRGKRHVFFSCRECTDRLQLAAFSEKLLREDIPARQYLSAFADWDQAFRSVADLPGGAACAPDALFSAMLADKKKLGDHVHFVLLEGPGRAIVRPLDPADVRAALPAIL